ncbi:MAG: MCE family protein [Gammaproteobacteria bacterium]|nr:MCE family protein [Gammaproteobacteria bacterium]
MKRDNINYLVVGSVVIGAFVLMLYTLYRLTGGVGENDQYFAHYVNAGGLTEGTPVTYQGYKVGSVSVITPMRIEGRTSYRVEFLIRDGWKIPTDSVAQIYSEGLLAETVINISEGDSRSYLSPGSELTGRQGVDIFQAVNKVADEASMLITDNVRPLLQNLNGRVTRLGDQIDAEIPTILEDIKALVASLRMGADRVPQILDESVEHKLKRVLDNADQTTGNLLLLSEGLLDTRKKLDLLLVRSSGTVADNRKDIRRSISTLRRSLDTVASYLEGIMHNLEGTSRNMNEFSREIRDNPGLLLGGKPPREVGVGHE